MPIVNVPGYGPVNFPDTMSGEEINAAAGRLHKLSTQKPASSEDFAPAPRTNRLPTDPSTGGFLSNLASGVAGLPDAAMRTVRGLSRINPTELPGAIVEGVKGRVNDYMENPAETIYEDPLSFLGDVAAVTGPAQSVIRGTARLAGGAARSLPAAAGTAADLGIDAAVGAVKAKLPGGGGSAVRGAMREAMQGYARRRGAAAKAGRAADEVAETIIDPVPDEMAAGYDRYMPNKGAEPFRLPNDITPDMPAPQRPMSMKDDAVTRSIRANGGQADLLRELLRAEQEATSGLTRAGRTMLTPEEQMMFNRATARPSYGQ